MCVCVWQLYVCEYVGFGLILSPCLSCLSFSLSLPSLSFFFLFFFLSRLSLSLLFSFFSGFTNGAAAGLGAKLLAVVLAALGGVGRRHAAALHAAKRALGLLNDGWTAAAAVGAVRGGPALRVARKLAEALGTEEESTEEQ